MENLHAVILAAGKGTRMGGECPKVLFKAAGKCLIEWVLSALSEAGIENFITVVGFKKEQVIAKLPTRVRWVEQSPQLGTGHAVRCARSLLIDSSAKVVLVTCGDMPLITPKTYKEIVELRENTDASAVILTTEIEKNSTFGRIVRNSKKQVEKIVEFKDATSNEKNITEGNAGVYCFKAESLWKALEKIKNNNAQKEYYLPDVIPVMIENAEVVVAKKIENKKQALGVNTPEDLENVEKILKSK